MWAGTCWNKHFSQHQWLENTWSFPTCHWNTFSLTESTVSEDMSTLLQRSSCGISICCLESIEADVWCHFLFGCGFACLRVFIWTFTEGFFHSELRILTSQYVLTLWSLPNNTWWSLVWDVFKQCPSPAIRSEMWKHPITWQFSSPNKKNWCYFHSLARVTAQPITVASEEAALLCVVY